MTLGGDTIAAVATASGRGGVAIVRVSGPDAFALARKLTGREMTPGRIAVVRDCVVLAFQKPHSYTGEDVVEFQCYGGSVTPRHVLESCFAAGARLAERGEFTARAVLNGRMDLDAAEGVLDLVDAKTDRAAESAHERLKGERARRHRALYDKALEISSTLEHALDVDEGELPENFSEDAVRQLLELRDDIVDALRKVHEGKLLSAGACVVLAGAPNAGKSSLMNALLGENRAIVSDTPGTTRDTIEDWIDIEGWPVRLVDTAGLRETQDPIEQSGVERAEDVIARADLVVALDCDIVQVSSPSSRVLHIHAKCDLDHQPPTSTSDHDRLLRVSAKTGEGLDALKHAIAERLGRAVSPLTAESDAADRPAYLLSEALSHLSSTSTNNFDSDIDILLLANVARGVAETLGRLVGTVYSDDLLDSLFSRFCVGK